MSEYDDLLDEGADDEALRKSLSEPVTESVTDPDPRVLRAEDLEEIPPEPPPPALGKDGELPLEVTAVWGVSEQSLQTARILVDAWGVERFLDSEIHELAKKEQTADARMDPIRKAFVAAQKKKEEKKR